VNKGELIFGTMPIGNVRDTTHSLIDSIKSADVIAVENKKPIVEIINHYGISTDAEIVSMFPSDFIGNRDNDISVSLKTFARAEQILDLLSKGKKVLCVSDEGSAIVTDPFGMKDFIVDAGYEVKILPGPSAIISALSYSKGYDGGSFSFHGMLFYDPNKSKKYQMIERSAYPSVIFYHHEIQEPFLKELADALGTERKATLLSSLTTKDEIIFTGSIGKIIDFVSKNDIQIPTIVVSGNVVEQ